MPKPETSGIDGFVGDVLRPLRGGNLQGRELHGIRLSVLKKGQNQITFGKDVLTALGLTNADIPLKVSVIAGKDKHLGKLLVQFNGVGEFQARYTSAKRPNTVSIMSSALPITVSVASASFKIIPESKAVIIGLPGFEAIKQEAAPKVAKTPKVKADEPKPETEPLNAESIL